MTMLTVTAKGQITLRQELLRHMQIAPGQQIDVAEMPDGELRLRAVRNTGKISDAFGMLKRSGRKPVSIEDMNEAIAAGWAGER
ncbi:AbrB/MazE/SpoVT family DNA-binding domain-containing protein [Sphingomonas sp. BIUV-7]|uniref:AbrB/MazE/SpoVT family DNA-binding domain-containing protein n=1 Tax=Sphingomonas natans TaxID=3063330 RepID=A0ABT8YAV9_9SPHN|nr:AbrB/MazE/SpoVT family DNA-binding domain-containing protein [Sphingomonas sp. BIUV-7]MDO6415450.1 AbrB/MazE/SpoVT family DNA-binding domain-containing protein [Sphingomonas sp. BIUV-7]